LRCATGSSSSIRSLSLADLLDQHRVLREHVIEARKHIGKLLPEAQGQLLVLVLASVSALVSGSARRGDKLRIPVTICAVQLKYRSCVSRAPEPAMRGALE